MVDQVHPLKFFDLLKWLDGRPLSDILEPYRRDIFSRVLYTFDQDGRPTYNRAFNGRGKKNWKSADLILACLYRFLAWNSTHGNDCYLLANDEEQAGNDLTIIKKLVALNPLLSQEVDVKAKEIMRRDGKGTLQVLPAKDTLGMHGKTALFVGYDEIHGYRNYDVFEAMAPDPTRHDCLEWITSYNSLFNAPGVPLHDLLNAGKRGDDPRMYFSWYAGDFTTDPKFENATPEERANPSMASWNNPDYLVQQQRRLPTHKYRRLHLNLPGMPDGAAFDAERVLACVVDGRTHLPPQHDINYAGFVDMSGGSSDDATLGIAHATEDGRVVLDLLLNQGQRPPFNPRDAVKKFAATLKEYRIYSVHGDRYAGQTFRRDFLDEGIAYQVSEHNRSELYGMLEPKINSGEFEALSHQKMIEQLLCLVRKGDRIDHPAGEHDDFSNAAAGAISLVCPSKPVPGCFVF